SRAGRNATPNDSRIYVCWHRSNGSTSIPIGHRRLHRRQPTQPLEKPMRTRGVLHVETEVLVPFFDIDAMDVVWHGHYVKYLELARCALLDKFGYGYAQMRESGYGWPIVARRLKYGRPATFNQPLVVRAEIVEWENRLKMNYTIRDAQTGAK